MGFITFITEFSGKLAYLARANPVIAVVVLIVLAISVYKRPLLFAFILLFCLLLLLVTYLLTGVTLF